MTKQLRIVVLGILGRTPVAGVAWQVLHYLVGLLRLGHDVYYVEDTQTWQYDRETGSDDCQYTVNYIERLTTSYGLTDRWAYRPVSQPQVLYGLSEAKLRALTATDVLLALVIWRPASL